MNAIYYKNRFRDEVHAQGALLSRKPDDWKLIDCAIEVLIMRAIKRAANNGRKIVRGFDFE